MRKVQALAVPLLALPLLVASARLESPPAGAAEAFARKDFRRALELYRAELGKGPDPARERRVLSCLAALGEWDEALREGETAASRHAGLEGARTRRLLADVYRRAPHWGFKSGDVVRRGGERREGERFWLHQEDQEAALRHLEAGREALYLLQDDRSLSRARRDEVEAEAIATDLALADLLQSRWGFGLMPEPRPEHVHDRYFAARREWAAFLRADDLYQEVVTLASQRKDKRPGALAEYARALLRHRLRPQIERLAQADRPLTGDEREALGRLGDPAEDLRSLGQRYPGDPLADEAFYSAGRVLEERGEWRAAEEVYEEVPVRYPKSPWASDAKAALQDLRRKDLGFTAEGLVLPDRPGTLEVHGRNVGRIAFAARRLDPAAVFLSPDRLRDARRGFHELEVPAAAGPPVASWQHDLGDDGSHRPLSGRVAWPPLPAGLYLVEARAEGIAFSSLVIATDLALVQKTGGDAVVYVADAVAGTPVAGARLVVKEWQRWGETPRVMVREGRTAADGTVSVPLAPDTDYASVASLAILGDRLAVSAEAYRYSWSEGAPVRVHLTTDRPVYRPGQSVHFRLQGLRASAEGAQPLAQAKATLIVRDPRGSEVYRHDHVSDGFGVVTGSLTLAEDPPLGEYPFEVQLEGEGRVAVAGERFRVEEYRKPDFAVSVAAGAALRAGETARAEVVARYYFGSPVADAEVTWRAFRTVGRRFMPFHDPHEWLYGRGYWAQAHWGPSRRDLVAQGTARTDAAGRARLEWATAAGEDGDYDVEAQVVDLSRREVRSSGSVLARRAAFDVQLRPDRGFYRPGETATVEVAAADANGRPVATEATLVVFRRTWSALREKLSEDPVTDQVLSTDEEGRAAFRWAAAEAGEYRVAATAFDARHEKVTADVVVRVAGEDTASDLFRLSNVEITLERATYREGETAAVLVASSRPGAVLLTEEVEGRILGRRTLMLGGKGRVARVALTRAHAPNVFLRATQVSGGRVYTAQHEVFVPPDERFLSVEVRPRSATVKPGAKEALDVRVTDAAGRGVSASLLLAVTDRAVEAIQAPYAPDVRAFFFGGRRGVSVQDTSSFAYRPSGATMREQKEVAYRRHGMPPGWWGSLFEQRRDWAGDELDLAMPAAEEEGMALAESVEAGVAGGVVGGLAQAVNAPASPAMRVAGKLASAADLATEAKQEAALAEARTRSAFADTAYWNGAVVTGPDGRAAVTVEYPDSLTEWKVLARGGDARARVGEATAAVVARKDLMLRLQSPRFFVERDRAVLSALVQNDLPQAVDVVARLRVSDELRLETPAELRLRVEKNAQGRAEWPVSVLRSGEAKIHVAALTGVESDAAEMEFPVIVHGADKQVAQAGRLEAGEARELVFDVPAERGPGTARLTLTVAPSLVSSLVEAIPYLVDYPYGCVEQTMSRFLPAVVLSRVLRDTGLSLEELAERRRLVIGDRVRRGRDPVFRHAELHEMVDAGLRRLYSFQGDHGGWGWWKGEAGDLRMTAYVLYGLVTAQQAGYDVDAAVVQRAVAYLESQAPEDTSLHARAYAAFALATAGRRPAGLDRLFARREDLTVHGRALLALALHRSGRTADARTVVSNLRDLAIADAASGTASWRVESSWWWWENDRVETQAFGLWALAEVQPDSPLALQVARWLLLNRQGSRWCSTRDTAHAIYALAAFAKGLRETAADLTVEATLGGVTKTFRITPRNVFAFDDTLAIGDADLGAGRRTLRLRTSGQGHLYYTAVLRYFTKEEDIRGSGTTLRLRREYFRREPRVVEDARGRRLEHDLVPLSSLAQVRSGQEVEVKLTIESPTPYDHLVFEDPKPAGFEPVDLKSGSRYGDGLCSNMELRDERVAFFVTHLSQGTQVIRYVLRAESPGDYHALPARGYAMYAPEITALADEWRASVTP